MKECRKDKIQYKLEAVEFVGRILEVHDVDVFQDVWQILHPLLEKVIIKRYFKLSIPVNNNMHWFKVFLLYYMRGMFFLFLAKL